MPTRQELRAQLRFRLEDTGAGMLWDDLTMNDAIAAAVLRYGMRVPREETLTLAVAAGATTTALPGPPDELDPDRIVRVLDERGEIVPRARPVPDPPAGDRELPSPGIVGYLGGLAQAWRVWDGALRLERPARGGSWRLEYLGPRAVPAGDLTPIDLLPGDEEAVANLSLGLLLRRRRIEDAKRGMAPNPALTHEIDRAEADAWRLLDRRRRRATGGWLS